MKCMILAVFALMAISAQARPSGIIGTTLIGSALGLGPAVLAGPAIGHTIVSPGIGLGGLGLNGLGVNGLGINGLGINGLGINGLGINGLGLGGIRLVGTGIGLAGPRPVSSALIGPSGAVLSDGVNKGVAIGPLGIGIGHI